MKSGELTRLIICLIIGALLMFLAQPWLYQARVIRITDVPNVKDWVSSYYTIEAVIVFGVSVFSVLFWVFSAIKSKASGGHELRTWRSIWYVLLFLNVLSIFIAIYFKKGSSDAVLSSASFFFLDIVWIFWIGTAVSSPNLFTYLPLGAKKIREIVGD